MVSCITSLLDRSFADDDSILVQVADVYFHVAADAVQLIQVHEVPSISRQYSIKIAPWCLDRPDDGPLGPKIF